METHFAAGPSPSVREEGPSRHCGTTPTMLYIPYHLWIQRAGLFCGQWQLSYRADRVLSRLKFNVKYNKKSEV